MYLTMAEKREFLEKIRNLVLCDVIGREERDKIFGVCLEACDRKLKETKEGCAYGLFELARV